MKAVFVACLLALCISAASASTLRGRGLTQAALERMVNHRQLAEVSVALASSCSLSSARQCSISQSQCLSALPSDDKSGVCACFQQLGNCLHNAGCLNGTYEDLHDQYCEVGDSYCCSEHGEFNGCGVRDDFSGSELCLCEQLYGGTYCNTTNAVCSSGSSCNVCSTCCRDYSGDTCDACVQDECDQNVCSDDSSCSVCSGCCKSYLSGPDVQADCNICVEQVC
eukprot:CAMPEP_0197624792 /NCGR_PEP_ID=MMETSP1338-20131121/4333_1 /TAXON_ID=43686 ORGANISM="Pelagodinium beii, Strain RCC1491" /NCGR_SAMPLE_ID=MMETSP1338 /ASSEMBLY_ACC=CAM_ASM_000754 /LENGTH=223 /DNA_ID=CAMNT_0043195021 /DNA_START=54 /DNA_END=725 /DNA_ORIENTATION=+